MMNNIEHAQFNEEDSNEKDGMTKEETFSDIRDTVREFIAIKLARDIYNNCYKYKSVYFMKNEDVDRKMLKRIKKIVEKILPD